METAVFYQERKLGTFGPAEPLKQVFVAESLGDLETLLSLEENEELVLEGDVRMSYRDFKIKYLVDIDGFYPSREKFLLRRDGAKTYAQFTFF